MCLSACAIPPRHSPSVWPGDADDDKATWLRQTESCCDSEASSLARWWSCGGQAAESVPASRERRDKTAESSETSSGPGDNDEDDEGEWEEVGEEWERGRPPLIGSLAEVFSGMLGACNERGRTSKTECELAEIKPRPHPRNW